MTNKTQLLKTIRAGCLECCAGAMGEVKKCHLQQCVFWKFRMGKDPTPSKPRGAAKIALSRRYKSDG